MLALASFTKFTPLRTACPAPSLSLELFEHLLIHAPLRMRPLLPLRVIVHLLTTLSASVMVGSCFLLLRRFVFRIPWTPASFPITTGRLRKPLRGFWRPHRLADHSALQRILPMACHFMATHAFSAPLIKLIMGLLACRSHIPPPVGISLLPR